jgi:Dyp-type peroxidase family
MSQIALTPGIDTPPASQVVILKGDIDSNEQRDVLVALQALGRLLSQFATVSPMYHGLSSACESTALVGFSVRFFKGELTDERDERRQATRFSLKGAVPPGLQRMYAKYDDRFAELCTDGLVAEKESDLLIVCESDEQVRLHQIVEAIKTLEHEGSFRCRAMHWGALPPDGRDHLGFKDGTSNLQDLREMRPDVYRRYVFVHDGEAGSPAYNGGTYLVFRKYVEHLEYWFADDFRRLDSHGVCHVGIAARERAIGRSCGDNLVIDSQTGRLLPSEFDESQGLCAFDESHIRQANPRRRGKTNFGADVIVRDARILRRGFPFTERCAETDEMTRGLLFLCFQSDIQRRGFEFIHNEWLMSEFMGGKDMLLNPDAGIIEPIDGCYYFVPPVQNFPGDVFFQ